MTRRTSARRLAGLCLLAAAAAMPAAASAQTTPQTGTFLGNYRPVATDDPLVQEAAAFLAEQAGGELASVESATRGGTTYRLEITLADGSRWSGGPVRQPDGSFWSCCAPTQLSQSSGEGEAVDHGSNQAPDEEDDDQP
jgi:hypothetical protein